MSKAFLGVFTVLLVPALAVSASKQDIEAAFDSKYELTTRSMISGQVKKPGTVLYVTKPGLQANKPSTFLKSTIIKNGEVAQAGGGSFIPGDAGRTLNVGDHVYLYSYKIKKDSVVLLCGTVESYPIEVRGSTKMQPYQLALQFAYEDEIQNIDVQRILDDTAAYLSTEQDVAGSADNTLQLGQTPQEIVEIMGLPKRKVDLGSKQIFVYDDLKITFEDGAVVDIE